MVAFDSSYNFMYEESGSGGLGNLISRVSTFFTNVYSTLSSTGIALFFLALAVCALLFIYGAHAKGTASEIKDRVAVIILVIAGFGLLPTIIKAVAKIAASAGGV